MKRYLVLIAYAEGGINKAFLRHFVIDVPTEANARRIVDERLHDRAWCARWLEVRIEDLDCEPLFDDGVDAADIEVIALDDLNAETPVSVGGSWQT
jgi:hypothetical protein